MRPKEPSRVENGMGPNSSGTSRHQSDAQYLEDREEGDVDDDEDEDDDDDDDDEF